MIFDKNWRQVRRLSKLYGMPRSDVRQMLAIEQGAMLGDVRCVDDAEAAQILSARRGRSRLVLGALAAFAGFGLQLFNIKVLGKH